MPAFHFSEIQLRWVKVNFLDSICPSEGSHEQENICNAFPLSCFSSKLPASDSKCEKRVNFRGCGFHFSETQLRWVKVMFLDSIRTSTGSHEQENISNSFLYSHFSFKFPFCDSKCEKWAIFQGCRVFISLKLT